nr:NADH dehydrogenase subunit 3 [Pingus sinensis]
MFFVVFFTLFFLLVFYVFMFVLSSKDFYSMKLGAFECGFVGLGKLQNSFSIHFFLVMLMFIIFDLEVVMFLGVMISDFSLILSFLCLFVFVLGGFYMEWAYGKLTWLV